MDRTPNLDLPYIMPSQAQKHVTHNEAIRALDAAVQLAVIDRTSETPPATPADGERYIVGAGATGVWEGHENEVAAWQDGAWTFYPPHIGWIAWIASEDVLAAWDGASWRTAGGSHPQTETLAINGAAADVTNRIAANTSAVLFNHDGGDHRLTINKNADGDTASLVFQTGFSGRAELGLAGDSNWRIKVSANGSAWKDVLVADRVSGQVTLPNDVLLGPAAVAAQERLHITAAGSGAAAFLCTNDNSGHSLTDGLWIGYSNAAYFWNYENSDMGFGVNNAQKLTIKADGRVGIGTTAPMTALDVSGPIRMASHTIASKPGADTSGAGAIIFLADETGGPVLAFSDGTDWRRVTDRTVVS